MKVSVILALCASTVAMGMTIFPSASFGTTKEPIENERFVFKYDPVSHVIAIRQHRECYVYQLNSQERMDVHSQHGLRTLEIKMIQEIDSGEHLTNMTLSDLDALNPDLSRHFCPHKTVKIHKITIL